MSDLNYQPVPSEALKLIVDKWGKRDISYSFITQKPDYPHYNYYLHPDDPQKPDQDPFENIVLRTDMVGAIEWALRYVGALTGLQFTRAPDDAPADIQFGINELDRAPGDPLTRDPSGRAGLPESTAGHSEVWFDKSYISQSLSDWYDGRIIRLILHEIGHALGLQHTFDVDGWTREDADSSRVSVMSYSGADGNPLGLSPSSLMMYDIRALQSTDETKPMYGVGAYNDGDTAYTIAELTKDYLTTHLKEFNNTRYVYATIWDSSGNDKLDFADQDFRVILDLREGEFSSVGRPEGTLSFPENNIGVAIGAKIEGAIGGKAGDLLIGNWISNEIKGGEGNDWILGGAPQASPHFVT